MQLSRMWVRRFRVFDDEVEIPLTAFTVLTGPNNLGKSTVLQALHLLFSSLPLESFGAVFEFSPWSRNMAFDFYRDYPAHRQHVRGKRSYTRVAIEVCLSTKEANALTEHLGIDVPECIKISAEYGNPKHTGTHFQCSGVPAVFQHELLYWMRQNVRFILIPATRTVHDLKGYLFSELVGASFKNVRRSGRRLQMIQRFYDDVQNEVADIAKVLVGELKPYLPTLTTLELSTKQINPMQFIGIEDVIIDDGARTSLDQKGDGIKSLFTMSVLQFLARSRYGHNLIFAIEEPEAHLHPSAVYELKSSLRSLSDSFQIVITSHSPILIERDRLASNIVVSRSDTKPFTCGAKPAENLGEIRQALGIKPHDNMVTAEVVIVVEGHTEERVLRAILPQRGGELDSAFALGRIKIVSAGGASKTLAVVRALARDATSCIVLLDSDTEGKAATSAITRSGLISPADVFVVPDREGCAETEFEDSFPPELYLAELANDCGIALTSEAFVREQAQSGSRGNRSKKWSDVMAEIVQRRGKHWDVLAEQAKAAFASAVEKRAADVGPGLVLYIDSIAARAQRLLTEQ